MANARNNMAEDAKARENVYGLLATVFRAEPSEEFIKQLRSPVFSGVLENLGISLGEAFNQDSTPPLTENLASEYTRLFIGPGSHISPHESIFASIEGQEGGLWGEKTVEVKKFIESAGFEYQPGFTGLPDHIAAEFEFMQKLAQKESELWSENEGERANWCLRVQKKFIDQHLSQWAPAFCDAVVEQAYMPFYAQMAEFTKSYLEFITESAEEQPAQAV